LASGIRLGMSLYQNLPPLKIVDKISFRPMLEYGSMIMLAGLAGAINETLDRSMIPRFWQSGYFHGEFLTGIEMNAIYAANYKLSIFITLVTQAFRYAAEPYFFKTSLTANAPLQFARIFHYYMLAGLLAVLTIALFDFEIVSFNFWGLTKSTLLPSAYWSGLQAVPILLTANLIFGGTQNIAVWYKVTNKVRFGLIIATVGAVITISVNWITIPTFGYMGSAWATFLCYTTIFTLTYILGQRYYPIPYRILRQLFYAMAACFTYFQISYLSQNLTIPVFITKFIGLLLFIGFLYYMEKTFPPFDTHSQDYETS